MLLKNLIYEKPMRGCELWYSTSDWS